MIRNVLYELFHKIIFENECSSNADFIAKFSDPDGVRSGKSGWSFGEVQWDTKNNPLALRCLRDCGFTDAEIHGVVNQSIDVEPLDAKLRDHVAVIEQYDRMQLSGCVSRAANIMERHNIMLADDAAILAIADYDNQFHLSDIVEPGYLLGYLSGLGRVVTARDVLTFKLATKWGKEHQDDCLRRYNNLLHICGKAA